MGRREVEELIGKLAQVRGLIDRINAEGCFDGEIAVKTYVNGRGRLVWVSINGGGRISKRPSSARSRGDANRFVNVGAATLQTLSFIGMRKHQIDWSSTRVTRDEQRLSRNVTYHSFRVLVTFE